VISILGVALSVMVLDMMLAAMTGLEEEIQAKFVQRQRRHCGAAY